MALDSTPPKGRLAQIRATYRLTKKSDPKLPFLLLGVFVGVLAVLVLIGVLLGHWIIFTILGLMVAFMTTTVIFGRRAERSAYSQIAGQPGAGAAVLNALRRGWTVTPAVAANRQQDIVHRAVGRPGVVLVGEGTSPSRVSALLTQEKKRLGRIVPDVPVYEFQVGDGEGQVPLTKLQRTIMKLPNNIRPAQASEIERRLAALGGPNLAIPKGPLPKGARLPKPPTPRGR